MSSILTVLTPAACRDLASLVAVKSDLGITGLDEDGKLAVFIRQASAAISRRCCRVFAREMVREDFRLGWSAAEQRQPLRLRRCPVVAETVAVRESGTLLPEAAWELDTDAGLLWRLDAAGERGAWCSRVLSVTYAGGYVLPWGSPPDLARACSLVVSMYRFGSGRDPSLKADQVEGVGRQEYWVGALPASGSAFPAEVDSLLAPYRAFPVG